MRCCCCCCCCPSAALTLPCVSACAPQFPDVGLAIELTDAVAISWDGRESAHCTSAATTQLSEENELLSLFFSLPANVVNAAERKEEWHAAWCARVASDTTSREELRVGDRVWCKWWVDRARKDGWFRATGSVAHTTQEGVTVAWEGRKGTVTCFPWHQAYSVLVRAGRLAPRIAGEEQPSGTALVSRRVSVYWPGDDRMYSGMCVGYDAATSQHTIEYDDGDCVSEVLGSALAPEYVVL